MTSLFLFWPDNGYFEVFLKNFICVAVILNWSCSFVSRFRYHTVEQVLLECCIYVMCFASGHWKVLELD
jgi:hypothetical protein